MTIKLTTAAGKGASLALPKLLAFLRCVLEQRHLTSLQRTIAAQVVREYDSGAGDRPDLEQSSIAKFLQSSQFGDVCYQALVVHASGVPGYTTVEVADMLERYLAFYVDRNAARYWSGPLSGYVMEVVEKTIATDAFRVLLSKSRLQVDAHRRFVEQLLATVASRLAAMEHMLGEASREDIALFEKRYKGQIQAFFRRITPPHLGTPKSVFFSRVYVAPTLLCGVGSDVERVNSKVEKVRFGDFLSGIFRTVVIGDPGGGKTTLATRVILDASSSTGLFGRTDVVPFVVTLREYEARLGNRPMSITDYIVETLNATYQLNDSPAGIVPFLCSSGRALVVFDGLDELLDTTKRQEVVRLVQLFCELYPTTAVLVTSRAVGYHEAPLDPEIFQVYRLDKLDDVQVREYVGKWFANAPDISNDERQTLPDAFLRESASAAPDLTVNPLMLSLMCNLYRGERYIPRNRPDLYEKCATMLFERWDRNRKILVPLPTEAHIRPAMMSIAFHVFETPKLQEGLPRSQLEDMATSYLKAAKYDKEEKARAVAQKFIDFCTGRAWVFTNTGTSGGEELYQFTHRTFLEFFAAAHLARVSRTPSDLLEILIPRILAAEWDVVAELAIQIVAKQLDGAADEILRALIVGADSASGRSRFNVSRFALRCLGFLFPRESIVTDAVITAVRVALEESTFSTEDSGGKLARRETGTPMTLVSTISYVAAENQEAALDGLLSGLKAAIDRRDKCALDLCCSMASVVGSNRAPVDAGWDERIRSAMGSLADGYLGQGKEVVAQSRVAAAYALEAGRCSVGDFVSVVDPRECFRPVDNCAIRGVQAPEAFRFLSERWRPELNSIWDRWALEMLRSIAGRETPWFIFESYLFPFETVIEDCLGFGRGNARTAEGPRALAEIVLVAAAMEMLVTIAGMPRGRAGVVVRPKVCLAGAAESTRSSQKSVSAFGPRGAGRRLSEVRSSVRLLRRLERVGNLEAPYGKVRVILLQWVDAWNPVFASVAEEN